MSCNGKEVKTAQSKGSAELVRSLNEGRLAASAAMGSLYRAIESSKETAKPPKQG
jgi:hypothetical protein